MRLEPMGPRHIDLSLDELHQRGKGTHAFERESERARERESERERERDRSDARRRPRRRVATGLERTRLRRPRQPRPGAAGRRPRDRPLQPASRPHYGARRRPGPSRTRHRLGLPSHTSPPSRPLDRARRCTPRLRVDRRLGRLADDPLLTA